MKKYYTETITLNGVATLLHTVEMPQNGKLNMALNELGYYEDSSGGLYYPVNALVHTFIGQGDLRELTWHAIRNIQRNLNDKNAQTYLEKTRRLHQLHEFLLGGDGFDESMANALCEVEGLNLLLEIRKENLPTYKANGTDAFSILGVPIDKNDLLLVFKESSDWYLWESDQPNQGFRVGWLLRFAVIALYAYFDIQGLHYSGLVNEVAAKINAEHPDDPVPIYQIQGVMDHMTIPAYCDELAGEPLQ